MATSRIAIEFCLFKKSTYALVIVNPIESSFEICPNCLKCKTSSLDCVVNVVSSTYNCTFGKSNLLSFMISNNSLNLNT